MREGSQVGTGLFVAAEQAWGKYGKARSNWLKQEAPFVKNDDNEAIALIGSRRGDQGNPFLKEGIGGNETTRLAVLAGNVMAIVAEIGVMNTKLGVVDSRRRS